MPRSKPSRRDPASRAVARLIDGVRALEGEGFMVRRSIGGPSLEAFDPFLLLDEMGPADHGPGEAKGAPDHPHRGFETVTYVLEGRLEHRDSRGNHGVLGPGDVQWMTAGSGVVHSEMPEREFRLAGGRMHAFQLWVNLPRRDKMTAPRYQEIPASRIPEAGTADGGVTVRVIAGEALGRRAVIETRTPIIYLHATVRPGSVLTQPLPRDHNAFVAVVRGEALLGSGSRPVKQGQIALLDDGGDAVSAAVPSGADAPADLLVIAGVPLREPVARYGPFVMNTRAEILQAVEDFQAGRMGRIDA